MCGFDGPLSQQNDKYLELNAHQLFQPYDVAHSCHALWTHGAAIVLRLIQITDREVSSEHMAQEEGSPSELWNLGSDRHHW